MTKREARIIFTKGLVELIRWANQHPNHEVALGEDFDEADPKEKRRHRKGSLHYYGLANDLALYIDGVYQKETEAYHPMGVQWESMNPLFRWGGRFKTPDGNHFSMSFEGKA